MITSYGPWHRMSEQLRQTDVFCNRGAVNASPPKLSVNDCRYWDNCSPLSTETPRFRGAFSNSHSPCERGPPFYRWARIGSGCRSIQLGARQYVRRQTSYFRYF